MWKVVLIFVLNYIAVRYCDIGEDEDLDERQDWVAINIEVCKRKLLSRIKKRRIGRRVIFDGVTFYGVSNFIMTVVTKICFQSFCI